MPHKPRSSRRGRAPSVVHPDTTSKVTVMLPDQQVAYLDRVAIDIRLKHRYAISRAEIIRALIRAAQESGVDITEAGDTLSLVTLMKKTWSR